MDVMHIQYNDLMVADHSVLAKMRNPAKKDNQSFNFLQMILLCLKRIEHRRHLRELPDYLLEDIGLTKHQVLSEFRKPFWKEGIY